MPFTAFGLCAGLLRALAAHGFQEPTPIQAGALPPALAGRDVVAVAETGSGKTAAFLLPLLQRLGQGPGDGRGGLRFLVLVPTRSGPGDLLEAMLKDPAQVGGRAREAPPELVEQRVYLVAQDKKGPLLRHLIRQAGWEQVLVFVASHHGADTVARKLNNHGIAALAMHGDLSQGARTGALAGFKDGATRVLVATDLAARGLDIEQLPCVINYDLPRSPNDYVHRVGRTGRAGTPGLALSLVAPAELQHMRLIEKRTGRRLAHLDTEGMQLL